MSEDWFAAVGVTMLGVSQTKSSDGPMVEYEFLEIKYNAETDSITYTPFLNGRRLNVFTLSKAQERAVTFSDLNNPTLKNISYRLTSPGVLNVHLSGNSKNGSPFEFDYDLLSEDCRTHF